MIEAVVTDFSRVLLFPKDDTYKNGLNSLNNKLFAHDPSYNFWDYFIINEKLLDYYRRLNAHVPTYIFTSETIQEHPAIKEKVANSFSGILSALEFRLSKSDPEIYTMVAERIDVPVGNTLFIDDSTSNITQARAAGMQTILFASNEQVIRDIDKVLPTEST